MGSHFDPECDADEGAFGASQPFDIEGWIVDSTSKRDIGRQYKI